jgi:MEDS: MEthanogen/methylotroph, DcmR Sensory domain
MKSVTPPISLAGSHLDRVRHVCAFFSTEEEEYRVLMPFMKHGFECGDKAVHVVNPEQLTEHVQRLSEVGIDIAAVQKSGQLEIQSNTEAYLRDGHFDKDRMLATFAKMASNANTASGFPLSRIVCRMDWAAHDRSRLEDVIEFESRVNDVWNQSDDAVICTYHLPQFSGDAVVDIMRTHPMVIIGGTLHENPFFTPPAEFMREFRGRREERMSHS